MPKRCTYSPRPPIVPPMDLFRSTEMTSMTLTAAATLCKLSYQQALRLVMIGTLRGWQDDRGRWQVNPADAQRLAKERGQPPAPAARHNSPARP